MMKTMGGFEKTKEVEADWGGGTKFGKSHTVCVHDVRVKCNGCVCENVFAIISFGNARI